MSRQGAVRVTVLALLTAALVATLALAGCGKAGTANVSIKDLEFQPMVLTVSVGTTVTWTNDLLTAVTVTSDAAKLVGTTYSASPAPNVFASQPIDPGGTFSYTFTTPGTYSYLDEIHGYMTGKVVVQ